MTYLVEVPIDGANSFVMEVDGHLDRGVVRSARPDQVVATVTGSFETALERLQPLARAIVVKLRSMDGPEEIGVEFGLKMNLEAGLIVARTATEGSFTVMLRWKRA